MDQDFKKCPYCKFDIPINATVCAHCGNKIKIIVWERDLFTRVVFGIGGIIKGVFSFSVMALILGYLFADSGKAIDWAINGAWTGAILGFIVSFHESKKGKIETTFEDN